MANSSNKKVLKYDKLSALPDVLLHHIMSFLDMKEAVQTSLLSSRWRYLWVSLPDINCNVLSWAKINRRSNFMNFVDNVLLLRDGSSIRKLELCCSYYYENKRILAWITSAIRKHVQEMHLQLFPNSKMELPQALTSSAITVLKLDLVDPGNSILMNIPNWICSMTRLTALMLTFVRLPEGNSSGELSFSYPVLENLTMIECHHEHLKVLKISTPQLKTFVIQNDLDPKYESKRSCQVELCAPSLRSLKASFKNYRRKSCFENFRMINLSSLVSAKFSLTSVKWRNMIKLLQEISCAKTLDLSYAYLSYFPNEVTSTYSNLRCLKLNISGTLLVSCAIYMLKKFPCIETLVLLAKDTDYQEGLFACKLDHLKYVEIGWLMGDEDECKCLKSLLDNARALEKLVIRMDQDSATSEKESFGRKIISLLKPSSRVSIFYYC